MAITRRKFVGLALKAGIAGAAASVLSFREALGMAPGRLRGSDVHVTGCMWCQCGCSMLVYVRDGRAVHVTGNPDDPLTKGKICMKPMGSLELLYSPHRLRKPLKRVSGRGIDARLVETTWDEALDEIAYRLKQNREKFGGESLGIWASGRGAADARYLSKAFARLYGTRNWEKTGPFCNYSGKIGTASLTGSRNTPWIFSDDDFFAADTYILIGSNLAATKPVYFSRLKERIDAGKCHLVCIDPRRSETARYANMHLMPRPGTDLALGLALCRYLVKKSLVREGYLRDHALGYHRFRDFLLGNDFSLRWAGNITGIPEADIRHLGDIIGGHGNVIMVANAGISHHANAVHTHRVFAMLAAMTGRYGRRANGFACLNNGAVKIGSLPVPEERIPPAREELGKNPVMWLQSLEDESAPYRLRSFISTGTPMVQWPDQRRIRRLMGQLGLSVANEIVAGINARFFDFMLPAAFWIEAGGLAPVSDESRFVWCPAIVDPPGEAKPDRWWWTELGKRMGWGDIFTDSLKDPVKLQDICGAGGGYSVKDFTASRHNSLRAPVEVRGKRVIQRRTLFMDGKFMTPSGKLEFWTPKLESEFRELGMRLFSGFYTDPAIAGSGTATVHFDKKRVKSPFQNRKVFMPLVKMGPGKVDPGRYPLLLTTGKPCEAIFGHTCHYVRSLHQFAPEQVCWIHPVTAERYGIAHGDTVEIRSVSGTCRARAVTGAGIRQDTLFVPSTFGEGIPFGTDGETIVPVNFVTDVRSRCPVSGQIGFKGIRVNIRVV